jgi:hypothetical protein
MEDHSNVFLNRIGKPSIYLPGCMVIWGLISVLTGDVPRCAADLRLMWYPSAGMTTT